MAVGVSLRSKSSGAEIGPRKLMMKSLTWLKLMYLGLTKFSVNRPVDIGQRTDSHTIWFPYQNGENVYQVSTYHFKVINFISVPGNKTSLPYKMFYMVMLLKYCSLVISYTCSPYGLCRYGSYGGTAVVSDNRCTFTLKRTLSHITAVIVCTFQKSDFFHIWPGKVCDVSKWLIITTLSTRLH